MAYGRAWLILKIGPAPSSLATPAVVQTDSSVAQTFVRWHMHMGAVDTHWWSDPDDTCLRRIGTPQMLGYLISWRQKRLAVATEIVGAGLGEKAGGSSLRGDPLVVFQLDLACQSCQGKKGLKSSASTLPMKCPQSRDADGRRRIAERLAPP